MNTELRRSKRYNDFLAVSVSVRSDATGEREIGPFAGRIINISRYGACLLMPLGIPDTYKVYSSTSTNNSLHLEIQGNMPAAFDDFNLSGHPIWMDPFVLDDIRAFKMGVEFRSGADSQQSGDIIDSMTAESIADLFIITDDK